MDIHDRLLSAVLSDFQTRRSKNPAFSLRAYARFLGIQPSGLSNILNGKRRISRKMGGKIVGRIPISEDIGNEIANSLKGKYSKLETANKYVVMENEIFEVISNWYYFAILSLTEVNDFVGTPRWIAKRLGISQSSVTAALLKLTELGLLKQDPKSKMLKSTNKNFTTTTDVPSVAIRRSHQEHLDLASQALHCLAVDRRQFGFINIVTDPKLLREAESKIQNFRRELCDFLERAPNKNAVFRLGTQLFPLTKEE